ncbi:V-type proton ATPase subunit G-like [Chironomus tepperi]|uniref:V-type proton ATPase subunit G-like n=1 Tax=Chironomus tepperi TaxID=113505 RepID=UPI00391F8EC5
MASQTQGIQQLLAAEKRAAEKVSDARKRKQKRLKQAKEEAQDEIEKYRQVREMQFKEFESKYMGSRESAKIDAETIYKIDNMTKALDSNKDLVIHDILSFVYDINPKVHKNFQLKMRK